MIDLKITVNLRVFVNFDIPHGMKRFIIFLGFSFIFIAPSLFTNAYAIEGFENSDQQNIFNIRAGISGATASLVNFPNGEHVLTTQAHVLEDFEKYPVLKLVWRKTYGRFFLENESKQGSFEISFHPVVLWKDNELDIAFLKVPDGLIEACSCKGLDTKQYHQGPAIMIGYPQTGVRTYPRIGAFWKHLGVFLETVEQRKSNGKTWIVGNEHVADMDGLPGNSGSSVLDEDGKVIGMLHLLKTWYGEGYKYKNPSISLLPIEFIMEKYQTHKSAR
ncbi:MAG: hypothetical protein A2622_00535 [Bdellovibrionales bacterium RIFCSPHIGHO2_01_FULL_40_29]|nr:MAG: hypothetical protein A2622_00535 [Bdellovibrionales bacterium RIFCSPHIGHO2_01_FULL_40_29]OFZ32610.1 MAG: hypothetical protein A3D17_05135 [Bdellovibrionales bacterium RIFCSPHIGHO2_02_FULL_40_15]